MSAHGARVALLAGDLAEANPVRLRLAIARWVQSKPFLPKASELLHIMEAIEDQETGFHGREGLEGWCADKNDWAKRIGADWWYRVASRIVDERRTFYVEKLEGWRAIEERARANRQPIAWYKPTAKDVAAIHCYVADCMAQGMSQDEFRDHVKRTGGCPRA